MRFIFVGQKIGVGLFGASTDSQFLLTNGKNLIRKHNLIFCSSPKPWCIQTTPQNNRIMFITLFTICFRFKNANESRTTPPPLPHRPNICVFFSQPGTNIDSKRIIMFLFESKWNVSARRIREMQLTVQDKVPVESRAQWNELGKTNRKKTNFSNCEFENSVHCFAIKFSAKGNRGN